MTVRGDNKCNNWPNFPISVSGATGGLIEDTVIICGGQDSGLYIVDECYSLTSEKATFVTQELPQVWRSGEASIVINDNILWLTGGQNFGALASTEYVTLTETILGPDLPTALFGHEMVAINSTCSMVIGGTSGYSKHVPMHSASTFYYDHNEGEWITGPSLMQARGRHAAGIVTDDVTGEDFVAVTGGVAVTEGYHSGSLDSTEILQDGEWVQGKINDTICHLLETCWLHST